MSIRAMEFGRILSEDKYLTSLERAKATKSENPKNSYIQSRGKKFLMAMKLWARIEVKMTDL